MVMQDSRTITNERDPDAFATLRLPKGRWVARVVVRWDSVDHAAAASIVCWTTIVSGGEADRHTVRTLTLGPYFHDSDLTGQVTDSLEMTAAANVPHVRGGRVQVRCRNDGDSPSGDDDLVVLREVRIAALRAGRLTIVRPTGTESWGSGAPHVVQLRRPGATQVAITDATETVASLDLGIGAWWITANLALTVGENGSYIYPVDWRCRLGLGGVVDRAGGAWESFVISDNRTTATMELAARITTAGAVRLRCGASEDWPWMSIRDLRVTAVPVGTLTLGDGSEDETWSSTGSGKPRVIHAHLAESVPIVGGAPLVLIARVPLSSGTWLVTAKYQNDMDVDDPEATPGLFPRVLCELRRQSGSLWRKTTTRAYGFGVPLQLVASLRRGTVSLRCRLDADDFRVAHLRHVRITAVRVR